VAGRLVAGAVGVALGAVSLSIASGSPAYSFAGSAPGAAALLLAGWSLVAAGLVFWTARRGTWVGPLLVAAGAAWFLAEWDNPNVGSSVVFTIGLAVQAACPPLVALVMFSHPGGRIVGWPERLAIAALAAGTVVLLGVLAAAAYDPRAAGCRDCPGNLLLIDGDLGRVGDLAGAGIGVGLSACVALIAAAGWRLLRSSPARRRLIAPGLAAGSLYLAAVGWTYAVNVDRAFIGSGATERRLWYAQAGALVLLAAAVVWGRARHQLIRRSLVDVVVTLGRSSTFGGLRDALAERLADPDLQVAYAIGDGRWADIDGAGVTVDATDDRVATPLMRDGVPAAMIVHRRGLLDDADLVAEVTSTARLLLDNEQLRAAARARETELRASRARIVADGDAVRQRLERDLHDGAQQRLVGLLLGIRLAGTRAPDGSLRRALGDTEGELEAAIASLRDVAHGIHPAALSTFGLGEALRALGEQTGRAVEVSGLPGGRLPAAVEIAAYQIVAEAAAAGPVAVDALVGDGRLSLDVAATDPPAALVELEDRVGALDGWVRVERADGIVHVLAEIPCGS
jgi:signal transduction histidine kinase